MWPGCPLYGTELFLMKVTASERGTPGVCIAGFEVEGGGNCEVK